MAVTSTQTLVCADEAATARLAARLAALIAALWSARAQGDSSGAGQHSSTAARRAVQIWLNGDLGAGKTTFTRALLRALGHDGRVRSPTYTLCEPYEIGLDGKLVLQIYHFDLYRFANEDEWDAAGFRDCFAGDALCIVEWPEKAIETLPPADLVIQLDAAPQLGECARRVSFRASTEQGRALLP